MGSDGTDVALHPPLPSVSTGLHRVANPPQLEKTLRRVISDKNSLAKHSCFACTMRKVKIQSSSLVIHSIRDMTTSINASSSPTRLGRAVKHRRQYAARRAPSMIIIPEQVRSGQSSATHPSVSLIRAENLGCYKTSQLRHAPPAF